jgi:hypothetical protein
MRQLDVERAAHTIVRLTESQRANYMVRAASLLDAHDGSPPVDVALRVEEMIYQTGNCDARILRFQRIAAEEHEKHSRAS